MNVTDATSTYWQPSLTAPGQLVQGVDDIKQCIDIILTTDRGSDPLRPLFGANIYRYIDAPVNVAGPNIVKEIVEAIRIWETRVTVEQIDYSVNAERLEFTILWTFSGTQGRTVLTASPGNIEIVS